MKPGNYCILINPSNFEEVLGIATAAGLDTSCLTRPEENYFYFTNTGKITNWRTSIDRIAVTVIDIVEFRAFYKELPNCTCNKSGAQVFCDNSCIPELKAISKAEECLHTKGYKSEGEIGFQCEICGEIQSLGMNNIAVPNPPYCDKCKEVIKHMVLSFRKDKVV